MTHQSRRICVAICLRYYLPGYKSGGPVRTISNLVDHLGDEFDFRVITSDRDIHDATPFPGVALNVWQHFGKARVYYATRETQTLAGMARVLNGIEYDILYLNSFFDSAFTIMPLLARRLGMLRRRPVIVAPRGELAKSALGIRAWKKSPYRWAARGLGLYSDVAWHASSEFEAADILREMGKQSIPSTRIAVNLPTRSAANNVDSWQPRPPGTPLRVVFLSRVAPMKNLLFALHVVAAASVPVSFAIYGMIDDEAYWKQCRDMMMDIPSHVTATYHGPLEPEQVGATLAAHDVLLLPTLGENYGHVIAESLTQGTPVLISDRTPWRGLAHAGVGWDLPLDEAGKEFVTALENLAALPPADLQRMRRRVADYGAERLQRPEAVEANRALFVGVAGLQEIK